MQDTAKDTKYVIAFEKVGQWRLGITSFFMRGKLDFYTMSVSKERIIFWVQGVNSKKKSKLQ